jgi:UDP-N-acetyl-D-glucosamine dehydrogenase
MLLLERRGAVISYTDPHVPTLRLDSTQIASTDEFDSADCVVIVTDHTKFDYADLVRRAALIVDTRNALKAFHSDKIVRL